MLKERNPQIDSAIDAVVKLFTDATEGSIIPWKAIEKASFPRRSRHWSAFRVRLWKALKKVGITERAINGVGLQKLPPSAAVYDKFRKKRIRGQLRREHRELQSIPDDKLAVHERDAKSKRIEGNRLISSQVSFNAKAEAILSGAK